MSNATEDLDALFDEISSGCQAAATAAAAAVASPPSPAPVAVAPAPASTPISQAHPDGGAGGSDGETGTAMYERLGGIVRLLHDSLRELGYDRSLKDAAVQINDAQGRLEYIATLTEQAANKVLNTIDAAMPEQDAVSKKARELEARWELVFNGKLGVEEFKVLAADSKRFAVSAAEAADAEKARLLDIMMAQDFQDLTGQLIKKIVAITRTAENELAQLLRDNAPPGIRAGFEAQGAVTASRQESTEAKADQASDLMQGPSMPGVALVQGNVDDLLESLGF